MNALNSGKPSSFKDTPKKRIARLFLIIVVGMVVGILIVPRITLFVRSYVELQPLLERARTVLDGTADPEPSEELDGKLYTWRFKKESHPSAAYTEVSPIKVTNIVSSDNNEVILTVSFHIIRYSANGEKESWIYYTNDKWYVRKNGNRWIVYKIETSP